MIQKLKEVNTYFELKKKKGIYTFYNTYASNTTALRDAKEAKRIKEELKERFGIFSDIKGESGYIEVFVTQ